MAGNLGSGRKPIIDMRPDRMEIIRDIVLGRRTLTEIAKRLGVDFTTVQRYRDNRITEEMRRSIMAEQRVRQVESETEISNEDRLDISNTYSLPPSRFTLVSDQLPFGFRRGRRKARPSTKAGGST